MNANRYAHTLTEHEQGQYVELQEQLAEINTRIRKFEENIKIQTLKENDMYWEDKDNIPSHYFIWNQCPTQYDIEIINGKHAVIEYHNPMLRKS